MIQQILRYLIKDSENRENPQVRAAYGKLAGSVGVASNLVLFFMKLTVGLMSGSIAIAADAVNNLSDAGSSVVTLVGFKLAAMPADREHPYGHGRYEYIAGLIVSFIIILIGCQLTLASANKIRFPAAVEFSWVAVLVLLTSIVIKIWLCHFNKTLGQMIRSKALEATAQDSRNDVLSTAAVLISTLLSHFANIQLDGYIGLLVAVFIIYSGIGLVRETIDPLLGNRPDEELVGKINQGLAGYEGVLGYHDLIIHNYGPGRSFVTVHAEVPADQDMMRSHDVIDKIEEDFIRHLHIPLTIHMDPVVTNDERVAAAKIKMTEILAEIDTGITFHDFRMVLGESQSNLIFDVVVDFDYPLKDLALKTLIREKTQAANPAWYTIVKVDRNYI